MLVQAIDEQGELIVESDVASSLGQNQNKNEDRERLISQTSDAHIRKSTTYK